MRLSMKQYIFLFINILAYTTLLGNFWRDGLDWSIICDWIIPISILSITNTASLVIIIKTVDKKKKTKKTGDKTGKTGDGSMSSFD